MYPSPFQLRKRASTTILCASVSFVPPKGAPALSRLINYGPFSRREMVTAVWCGEAKSQVASLGKREHHLLPHTPNRARRPALVQTGRETRQKRGEGDRERESVGLGEQPSPLNTYPRPGRLFTCHFDQWCVHPRPDRLHPGGGMCPHLLPTKGSSPRTDPRPYLACR